jgi:hypothetical protein
VLLAAEIKIGLEFAEIGQDIIPTPAARAEITPLVIVTR